MQVTAGKEKQKDTNVPRDHDVHESELSQAEPAALVRAIGLGVASRYAGRDIVHVDIITSTNGCGTSGDTVIARAQLEDALAKPRGRAAGLDTVGAVGAHGGRGGGAKSDAKAETEAKAEVRRARVGGCMRWNGSTRRAEGISACSAA
jgi:hypothetical protein